MRSLALGTLCSNKRGLSPICVLLGTVPSAFLVMFAGCGAPTAPALSSADDALRGPAAAWAFRLRAEAARSGTVRVVVTLAIAGPSPPSAEAIRAAQDRLLSALAATRYEHLRRFQNVPQLAMTAHRDALEVLLSSPLVASVMPDELTGTMTPRTPR